MATWNVPGDFISITAAAAAASPGDVIIVAAVYAGNEAATVTVDNLTIDAPASVLDISIAVGATVKTLTLTGDAAIQVFADTNDNVLTGNLGANYIWDFGGNDRIDGGGGNDTIIYSAGEDVLKGGAGDDVVYLTEYGSGSVRGGVGIDTVTGGLSLGTFSFAGVEILDLAGLASVSATASQLSSFTTITDSVAAASAQFTFYLRGAGGTIDFTTRILGAHPVVIVDDGLTAGVTITGTVNDDRLTGTAFDDVLNGGTGYDTIIGSAGIDALSGGDGQDRFEIEGGSGSIDGGDGVDTVVSNDLGAYTLSKVEELKIDLAAFVVASPTQLSSFAKITDDVAGPESASFALTGTGGVIDFSSRLESSRAVYVADDSLSGATTVTGTVNADIMIASANLNTLNGGAGNDRFLIDGVSGASGAVNGGLGFDTVISHDLQGFSFTGVEILDVLDYNIVHTTATQLASFAGVTASSQANDSQLSFLLQGAGGSFNFLTLGTHSVHAYADLLTGPTTITGTEWSDIFNTGTATTTVNTRHGDDVIELGAGGGGSIDGGTGMDTVRGWDLGGYSFKGVERLDSFGFGSFSATLSQLSSITQSITDSTSPPDSQLVFNLRGAGGNLNLGAVVRPAKIVADSLTSSLTLMASTFNDVISGTAFADNLNGNMGDDIITGDDEDVVRGDYGDDTLVGVGNNVTASYAGGFAAYVDLTISGAQYTGSATGFDTLSGIANLVGSDANDVLTGDGAANRLIGGFSSDVLTGGAGDDFLDGGAGSDYMNGGAGSDTVSYAHAAASRAFLWVNSSQVTTDFEADTLISIENVIGSSGNDLYVGNDAANHLEGRNGDDKLEGRAGADRLDGGAGFDTASYANSVAGIAANLTTGLGSVGEAAGDTYISIEKAEGSAFSDALTGDSADNVLVGGAGGDSLEGAGGNDTLDGGLGIDVALYSMATAGVKVNLGVAGPQDTAGAGVDTLIGFEHLTGSSFADILTGDANSNFLTGGAGADVLDGGGGADSLDGGAGSDIYKVDNAGVVITEAAGMGTDSVRTTLSAFLLGDNLETLTFAGTGAFTGTGNALNNTITGGAGNDTLDGGAGNDRLRGAGGNDTVSYASAGGGVVMTLAVTAAQDTGGSGIDALSGIENLVGSSFNDSLAGNGSANLLMGGEGADTLTGGGGADTLEGGTGDDAMAGGAGDDIYVVDAAGDSVAEALDEGVDTVRTSLSSYVLGNNVERLVILGGGQAGTGNELDNELIGSDGSDNLNGGAGNDLLQGGAADDVLEGGSGTDAASYAGAAAGIMVNLAIEAAQETLGAGIDTLTGIEDLLGSSYGDTLIGRSGANRLVGGGGSDWLDGGIGDDRLEGGAGDDFFKVDSAADVVVEGVGEGTDTVETTASRYKLSGNVENLLYTGAAGFVGTGNHLGNVLVGGAGDDTLDGRAGDDVLSGGAGTDTATYSSAAVGVTVNLGLVGAQDTIGAGSDSLAMIENLVGSSFDDVLTGNAGANDLRGGAGNDMLDGAGGADRMTGGAGNDTFSVDDAGDRVSEALDGGDDTVLTSLAAYRLGSHLEDLVFTGTVNFSGTGNDLANMLCGGAGDDVLAGGQGGDRLLGGTGMDVASYAGATAAVQASLASPAANGGEAAGDSYDSIEGLRGSRFGDVLTGDSGDNRLNGARGADTLTGGLGMDRFVFDQALVAGNIDTILDYTHGEDGFDLSASIFGAAGSAGMLAADAFRLGAGAQDSSDRIIYDAASGNVKYDADGMGGRAATVFAVVSTGLALSEADFRLM